MNEVSEYQAELMVAAKEDEGAVMRIQELERRGAIAESGARRIYEVGMEMQSQYKDEIHELKGMLSNAQDRLSAAQENSEYAHSIAQRLYRDGRIMQRDFTNVITEYHHQSLLSEASSSQLAITNAQNNEVAISMTNEVADLRAALALAHRKNEMCESNMEQVVKDSRKKVHEANQAKLENDMRLRYAESEADKRRQMIKDMESEAISRLRAESSSNFDEIKYYKDMWNSEYEAYLDVKNELKEAKRSLKNSCSLSSAQLRVEDLENQVQIGALRIQDLTSEVSELTDSNLRIKDENYSSESGGIQRKSRGSTPTSSGGLRTQK